MCGIVGVISWSESHRVTRADLKRMTDAIAHRGPDGEGFYFSIDPEDRSRTISPENPQVAFGFRRLAVLDPDPRSMQPFLSTDGRYVMVFNGEIYNYRELREELSALDPSYVWRTQGDTEVLIQSYAQWGEDCLHKLNGMFAIAIWDHEKKSLFLARDRMGQKPLYCSNGGANEPDVFAFGSEIGSLSPWNEPEPEMRNALEGFLTNGYSGGFPGFRFSVPFQVGPAETCRRVVTRRHEDGRWVFSTNDEPTGDLDFPPPNEDLYWESPPRCQWGLHPDTQRRHAETHIDSSTIKNAVQIAVQRQLVSDVPLGVFLSGGIDSSVIALCARKHGPVKTFSIAFDDPRYDESQYAREVAKHLGTDHHDFRVTPNVMEDLPKLARVFGEPFADSSSIPTHYLCRETRKHVTVALSGDGGDELFGGYERYEAVRCERRFPRLVKPILAAVARPFSGGHPKSRLARLARFLVALDHPLGLYDSLTSLFQDEHINKLLGRNDTHGSEAGFRYREWVDRTGNPVTAALAADRVTYLPNDLLTKVDRCSMLHSLEVRSPFMDHELVELAAQLTEDQLLKGGKKRMLREAFASELPASVFNRPKMGFAVPIGEWFRGPLKSFLRDHLFAMDSFAKEHFQMNVVERLVEEHESQRRDHSQRLYALLMLEMWWKHCVKDGRPASTADL